MAELHKNLINGEWVGADGVENINPSNTNEVVGVYARATRRGHAGRHRGGQGGVPGLVALGHLERQARAVARPRRKSSRARKNSASC